MDERIGEFLKALEKELEGLSEEERNEALAYYREYLNDAYDEGKDMDEIFLGMGTPEKVAGMIKAELNIARMQENPGLKSFVKASGSAFRVVTRPLYIFLLSVTIFLSYCMVALFYAGAFLFCLAGFVSLMVILYEAFSMPARFLLEIAGTVGMGLLTAGVFLLFCIMFAWCGKLFIRMSMELIRAILNKPEKPGYKPGHVNHVNVEEDKKAGQEEIKEEDIKPAKTAYKDIRGIKGTWMRKAVKALAIISAAGSFLFGVSGIPWRYFMIFNSMKPPFTMQVFEYALEDVNRLHLSTANSYIEIVAGPHDDNKIVLTYEQPDWTDFETRDEGGMLAFFEKSNGRLPFFNLVAIHECVARLTLSLTREADFQAIRLESTGGKILISDIAENAENIYAKTYNGDIHMYIPGNNRGDITDDSTGYLPAVKHGIKINTSNGSIFIGGEQVARENEGENTPGRDEKAAYYKDGDPARLIELISTNGNIFVE